MEAEGSGSKAVAGVCQWTPTQSSFMLTFLSSIVASGTRTSSCFKKVHLNSCAKALNDHFKLNRTGDQIGNHLKTWKRKYVQINQLRKLSAAIWEDTFTITLNHEHYTGHVATHKADDEYLNKPLQYYGDLATIFGNSVATGQYAKGSNDPLGTAGEDGENEGEENGATQPLLVIMEQHLQAADQAKEPRLLRVMVMAWLQHLKKVLIRYLMLSRRRLKQIMHCQKGCLKL